MSGKDVTHLLIILGVGGYSFYGSMTGTGLGGWLNDAQLAFSETYSVQVSVLLALCLVSVLTLLAQIAWNIVSGSQDGFEQSIGYRLFSGVKTTPATPHALQGRVIPQTTARK